VNIHFSEIASHNRYSLSLGWRLWYVGPVRDPDAAAVILNIGRVFTRAPMSLTAEPWVLDEVLTDCLKFIFRWNRSPFMTFTALYRVQSNWTPFCLPNTSFLVSTSLY
jgi:hypothetical protein